MAVRGKEAAAILPEPRPDAFAVGLRDVQAVQRGARKKLEAALAHGRRELVQLRFQLEQKHEPVRLAEVNLTLSPLHPPHVCTLRVRGVAWRGERV